MLEDYNYLKDALSSTYGYKLTKHERLADGVFRSTYSNGTSIIVNYNKTAYNANGVTVEAEGYAVSTAPATTTQGGAN